MPRDPERILVFIRREVRNQGFDLATHEGQRRVDWMKEAWDFAVSQAGRRPTFDDVLELGRLVEREKNKAGLRRVGVRVGDRLCPPAQEVEERLRRLLDSLPDASPLEFYFEFEMIHPFVDGNGRTGKVLLHWLNGQLDSPEMPPDLFGGGLP